MGKFLDKLISQGEHQQQDFKFAISDSRKIAKSLVAFANTDGGRLLIGVKDNGAVVGVADDEEVYMIEAAAQMYCKPPIDFSTETHQTKTNKIVLEVQIKRSDRGPHYAQDNEGKWWAYLRKDDENILASKVQLEVWKKKRSPKGALIRYSDVQRGILKCLQENEPCSLNQIAKQAKLPYRKAERVVVQLILADVVKMEMVEKSVVYFLNKKPSNRR